MAVPSIPKKQTVPKLPTSQINQSIPKAASVPSVTGSSVTTGLSIPKASAVPKVQSAAVQPLSFSTVPKPPTTQNTYSNPQLADWSTKQQELFKQWEDAASKPFEYNPESDPAYQAQVQLSQQRAKVASRNALESANERGLLTSTLATNQLGQIQQSAEQEALSYIPQYREQAYNQYQNNLAQIGQALSQAMNLRNQQFNEGITKAGLTGTYMPEGAEQLVNSLYGLKSQAEKRGITAQERAQLSTQADQIRAQLTAMGVDVSGIGADTSLANSQVGQRTLAGKQLDYAQQSDLRDYNESVRQYDQNFGYQQGRDQVGDNQWQQQFDYGQQRDQVADEQWMKEFNERVRQFGMNNALDWANHSISQQNANVNAGQLALSRDRFNYEKTQDANRSSGSSSSGGSNSTTKLDAKDSYDAYTEIVSDFSGRTNGFSQSQALEYAKTQKPYLTDTHYKNLIDYILENGK